MIALLVLGLAVGAVGYAGSSLVAGEVEDRVHDDQQLLAENEVRSFEKWDDRNRVLVSSFGDRVLSGDVDIFDHDTRGDYTDEGVYHYHQLDATTGEIVRSTNGDLEGQSVADLDVPWQNPAEHRRGFLSTDDPFQIGAYETGGTNVLAYGQEYDPDEEEFLVLTMDLESYADEITDRDGSVTYVVDGRTDEVVLDSRSASFFDEYDEGVDFAGSENGSAIHEIGAPGGALGESAGEYGDDDYIATAAPIDVGDEQWYAVIHTPESEAYGFVQTVTEYGLYASVAGVLLVVVVGGVVGRNTSRSIDRLTDRAERMEEGDLDVEFETARIDSIGRLYDGFANMRDSLKDQIREAEAARADAEEARAETERINRHLEAKAEEHSEVMQVCADGDVTARMDPESENEAMVEIATEFNEMMAQIEETIAHLKAFATEVATASEEVTASSQEVRTASERVTESVQEISDGADRQNESLQSVTHEMNGLSTTIEQIAASSNQVADLAERTADAGDRGRKAAQDAIEGMNEIESESDEAVSEIERLEAEMEQIDELIEFISEVAEQTNMLALNANIEAARSGASGEGFSVVAGEVKELAEETKDAAEDIEERLERIKAQTERTATEVQTTSERVAEHTDSVERAVDALEDIADYAEETNDGVQEISAASEQQAASTQEVVAMVDEAATISEETTAESQNVAAAAEEQTSALTQVTRSASDLASQASQLSEALDRFETDAEVTERGGFALGGDDELDLLEDVDLEGVGDGERADEDAIAAPGVTDDTVPADDAVPAEDGMSPESHGESESHGGEDRAAWTDVEDADDPDDLDLGDDVDADAIALGGEIDERDDPADPLAVEDGPGEDPLADDPADGDADPLVGDDPVAGGEPGADDDPLADEANDAVDGSDSDDHADESDADDAEDESDADDAEDEPESDAEDVFRFGDGT